MEAFEINDKVEVRNRDGEVVIGTVVKIGKTNVTVQHEMDVHYWNVTVRETVKSAFNLKTLRFASASDANAPRILGKAE